MVTRQDIAERLNVSVSVVSRALNNSGYVKPEKKEQIIRVAREMGYNKQPVAIASDQKFNRQILFYCHDIKNAFNVEVYEGMLEAVSASRFAVMIYVSPGYAQIPGLKTDGIIFSNESLVSDYLNVVGRNYYLPVVACSYGYNYLLARSVPLVDCDLRVGTEMLLEYLRGKGHRKIAMLSMNSLDTSFGIREIRWRQSMGPVLGERLQDYFFSVPDFVPYHEKSALHPEICNYFGKGALGAERFLESGCDATAVVCFNEEMALGFCRTLTERGVRIPEDLSVASFDGTPLLRYFDKPLTHLDLHPYEQGRVSAKTLLSILDGERPTRKQSVEITLVEGATVAAPKAAQG